MTNNIPVEILKTNSDSTQYRGTVTIASYLGDRLIQKETHHNAGLENLFSFMSSCLQGNWYEAKFKRPCKLVMLKASDSEVNSSAISLPTDKNALDDQQQHFWSSKYAVCSPIMYDTAATATTTETSSSINYHFRVPFLSLVGGTTIKKLLLLPPQATNYQTDACAYFILKNGIEVPVYSANFTVIIDWTLEFTNNL